MRIISQNKYIDVNYDNVEVEMMLSECRTGGSIYYENIKGIYKVLGSYTKERALEVMEELRYQYLRSKRVYINDSKNGTIEATLTIGEREYYEMPKE